MYCVAGMLQLTLALFQHSVTIDIINIFEIYGVQITRWMHVFPCWSFSGLPRHSGLTRLLGIPRKSQCRLFFGLEKVWFRKNTHLIFLMWYISFPLVLCCCQLHFSFELCVWFCVQQVLKKATIRKEQEPDFEEKRFNVTIGEDEREFDKENDFFRERSYRIIRE